jgi:hypothetical protein
MIKEPLLKNEETKETEDDFNKDQNKEIIENKKEGYENYDAFHNSNIISKIFFCWVNKVLRVNT